MRILAFIENLEINKKILKHLDLWDLKARPPPKRRKSSQVTETIIDYSDSQLLLSDDYLFKILITQRKAALRIMSHDFFNRKQDLLVWSGEIL